MHHVIGYLYCTYSPVQPQNRSSRTRLQNRNQLSWFANILRCLWYGFNSTLVRLQLTHRPYNQPRFHCFNSTLVRLQLVRAAPSIYSLKFQFHTGSITAQIHCRFVIVQGYVSIPHWFDYSAVKLELSGGFMSSFNSTLVRLQLNPVRVLSDLEPCFNSTLVRLQPSDRGRPEPADYRFNSTLVRLQRKSSWWLYSFFDRFQFHTGSITAFP